MNLKRVATTLGAVLWTAAAALAQTASTTPVTLSCPLSPAMQQNQHGYSQTAQKHQHADPPAPHRS